MVNTLKGPSSFFFSVDKIIPTMLLYQYTNTRVKEAA